MNEEIVMWKCSACHKDITSLSDDKDLFGDKVVSYITHFDITRSNKVLDIEDNEIIEDIQNSNMKMQRSLCEDCFNIFLNESPTMLKLFKNPITGKILF